MLKKSNKAVEEQGQEEAPVQRVRADWNMLLEKLSQKAIVKNVPFLAFVVVLCVLYIGNTQSAIETQRELSKQNKILKELRWEYMDAKSQLMYVQMESQVIKRSSDIGLAPLQLPAYAISKDSIITQ